MSGAREYWCDVLSTGGSTTSRGGRGTRCRGWPSTRCRCRRTWWPRWDGWADELAAPLGSLLLAAARQGARRAVRRARGRVGCVARDGGRPLPCRVTTAPRVVASVGRGRDRVGSELLAHPDFPVDDLRPELGLAGRSSRPCSTRPARWRRRRHRRTPCCGSGLAPHGDGLVLRLRYRTDVLDAEAAARIAGYHLTALALIAADPDADHGRQSLLSAEELRFQLEGLAGPRRELPDRRVHELFEERVRRAPGRRRGRPRRPGSGPTGSSTPAPTGWHGPCWRAGCGARTSSPW